LGLRTYLSGLLLENIERCEEGRLGDDQGGHGGAAATLFGSCVALAARLRAERCWRGALYRAGLRPSLEGFCCLLISLAAHRNSRRVHRRRRRPAPRAACLPRAARDSRALEAPSTCKIIARRNNVPPDQPPRPPRRRPH
jgi:hypothetical protein